MTTLDLQYRINAFATLAKFMKAVATNNPNLIPNGLEQDYKNFQNIVFNQIWEENPWFIEKFVRYQLNALAEASEEKNLYKWLKKYQDRLSKQKSAKTIAVIMAGNIPFVGFSDYIAVLISGNKLLAKLSSKDTVLPKTITNILLKIAPKFKDYIELSEDPIGNKNFDAVIATGSDNTARYFEYYFAKYPNIIRKNRTSVAILTGNETDDRLKALADDVFLYFGLGCRNVSKIYLPKNYDLNKLFKNFYHYNFVIENHKYANNYDYNKAIFLLNREKFYDNGFIMLKQEDIALVSPTAVLYYQYYSDINRIPKYLDAHKDKLQAVISDIQIPGYQTVPFGQAQKPMLWEYPDNIDVMDFLLSLE